MSFWTIRDLKRFFRVIQDCGNLQHEIMLKLLFYTAVRVSELARIRVEEVDCDRCKIFISQGKGAKDRYILFPASFRLVLKSHLQANPKNRYLFESQRCTPFTPRRVQQIVQAYRDRAGIAQHVHPVWPKYPNVLLSHRVRLYHDARFNLNCMTLSPILII
jgi:integrase/recombinase XerD